MEKIITHLQLQARKSSDEPWGILNTVPVPHLPDISENKAYKQAKATIIHLQSQWHENYDPLMQFRIVEL
jgi:hypothetical protein